MAVGWWQLVGDNWLVVIGGWQVVGGSWLVASGGDPRDVRAYIRPLGEHQALRLPCQVTAHTAAAKHRAPGRTRPRGRRAPSAAPAAQITHTQRPRSTNHTHAAPHGPPGRTSDPLESTQMMRLPRKSHPRSRGGDPRSTRAYIRPLGERQDNWLVTIGW